MILIEGKLYESTIIKSDYPGCNLEIVYASDKPSEEYYKHTPYQIHLLKKILEDSYLQQERLKKIIENLIPPKDNNIVNVLCNSVRYPRVATSSLEAIPIELGFHPTSP